MKRLAIIPARGGSKRILNKNIRNFCGKPIISYIIETASKTNLFSKIHISTESKEIFNLVSSMGLKPDFKRPKNLADDHTPLMPVIKYVVEKYKEINQIYEEIWLLYPCSPLITEKDLNGAADLFKKQKNKKPLLSICEYSVPIEWAYLKGDDAALTPINPGKFATRSQDLEKKYFDTGNFVVFASKHIEKFDYQSNGNDTDYLGYKLTKSSSIDIDDLEDWAIAEAIYKNKNIK